MPRLNLRLEFIDLAIEFFEVIQQALHEYTKRSWQFVAGIFNQLWDKRSNVADALRDDDSKFAKEATDLVALRRARFKKPLSHMVQCEHALLLDILDRHEPHVWPTDGLAYCLSVCSIILLVLT